MTDDHEIELIDDGQGTGTINTPMPGLIFADPEKWAQTLVMLQGSLVEVLLADGQSTLGHIAGFADNPEDEDEVDLVLHSEWDEGPAGARIPIPFQAIALIQVL